MDYYQIQCSRSAGLARETICYVRPATKVMLARPLSTIADQRLVAIESWQPGEDIDILARIGTLVHLSGAARSVWNHGIRLGLAPDQLHNLGINTPTATDSLALLSDWFGSTNHPVARSKERISVVYAFADPPT